MKQDREARLRRVARPRSSVRDAKHGENEAVRRHRVVRLARVAAQLCDRAHLEARVAVDVFRDAVRLQPRLHLCVAIVVVDDEVVV